MVSSGEITFHQLTTVYADYPKCRMPRRNVLLPMPLPLFQPMPLGRSHDPFSDPEWIYEVKWDSFRALAYVDQGECRLVSRNGNQFKSFPALAGRLPAELRCRSAVLDSEIVCLDRHGKTQFKNLLFLFPAL